MVSAMYFHSFIRENTDMQADLHTVRCASEMMQLIRSNRRCPFYVRAHTAHQLELDGRTTTQTSATHQLLSLVGAPCTSYSCRLFLLTLCGRTERFTSVRHRRSPIGDARLPPPAKSKRLSCPRRLFSGTSSGQSVEGKARLLTTRALSISTQQGTA